MLVLVGVAMLRLSLSGAYQAYIKSSMGHWVTMAGAVLLALGCWTAARELLSTTPDPDALEHGTGRIAWLLLAPLLTIFLVAPPALGTYAADRSAVSVPQPAAMPRLVGNPVRLGVVDFAIRAVWDDGETLEGHTVTMVGFVTTGPSGTWYLTRMQMSCCAADAQPVRVKVLGAPDFPPDTWVQVTGHWVPGGGTRRSNAIPWVQARATVTTSRPADPYE
jgi:uncharacterized repeat protein (TIGR03943 family)